MSDNTDFFFNFEKKKLITLIKYKDFRSQGNEQISILSNNPFSKTFKIRYNYITPPNTFDVVYKLYIDKKMETDHPHTNMLYEFYIGKFINNFKQFLPNFVYTFGYNIRYTIFRESDKSIQIDHMIIPDEFVLNLDIIENSCDLDTNKKFGLFTEYVSNSTTLKNIIKDPVFLENLDYNLFTTLFQIYSTLYILRDIYTHQDTNLNNVLVKTLDKEINIIYNIDGVEYILKTKYIAVFIDYASSHLHEHSMDFIDVACRTNCNKNATGCDLKNLVYYTDSTEFKDSKNFGRINKSVDLFLISFLMHEKDPDTNEDYIPDTCELKTIYNSMFEYTMRNHTNPYGWISNRSKGNVSMMVKEYYRNDPADPIIRYTSHVMTKFLIPLYGHERYIRQIDPFLDELKIHSNLSTKCEYIKSSRQSELISLAELEVGLRPAKESPISLAELEVGLKPAQVYLISSFSPLTIAPGRFKDNKDQFKGILGTIEIRPANLSPAGGYIDEEISEAIGLLNRIKEKPDISERDLQKLHRLFYNLTTKAVIFKDRRQITKEQIYTIMNNLFNYSAAVAFPGRRGGYYEKYVKYKAKYLRLKAENVLI